MGKRTTYGYLKDVTDYTGGRRTLVDESAGYLRSLFEENAQLLKKAGLSVSAQLRDIESIYGMRLSETLMSELKAGKRYKTGLLTLIAIRHYWKERGYKIVI